MSQPNEMLGSSLRDGEASGSDWDTYKPPNFLLYGQLPEDTNQPGLDGFLKGMSLEADPMKSASKEPTMNRLHSFTVFPNLPVELQTKIWKLAAVVPRIVEVKLETYVAIDEDGEGYQFCDYDRISPSPAIVRACVASRKEAISIFPATTETYKIHINPKVDVLLITADDLLEDYSREQPKIDFQSISYLAIKNYDLSDDQYFFDYTTRYFARQVAICTDLEELILVDPTDDFVMESWTSSSQNPDRCTQDGNMQIPILGLQKRQLVRSRVLKIEMELQNAMVRKCQPRGHETEMLRSVWWDTPRITCMSEAEFKARF